MNSEILEVTDSSFDYEVLDVEVPSLVYFLVSWSRECRDNLEILENLADDYKDKIRFFKLNVGQNSRISSRFQIRLLPTIMVLRRGDEIKRFTGDIDPVELGDFLDELVEKLKPKEKQVKPTKPKKEKVKKRKPKKKKGEK